jgi:hypothetical protein
LSGTGVGADKQTHVEDTWSPPSNGTMIGMYREMPDGKTTFYEFLMLSEENGAIVLRMKHFDEKFAGWEEKNQSVIFDATEVSRGHVVFVSRNKERPTTLEYRLSSKRRLDVFLTRIRDGKTLRDEFHYMAK